MYRYEYTAKVGERTVDVPYPWVTLTEAKVIAPELRQALGLTPEQWQKELTNISRQICRRKVVAALERQKQPGHDERLTALLRHAAESADENLFKFCSEHGTSEAAVEDQYEQIFGSEDHLDPKRVLPNLYASTKEHRKPEWVDGGEDGE